MRFLMMDRRAAIFCLLVHCSQTTIAADRIVGQPFSTRSEVIAQHGIAATSHPLATEIALDILKRGGNAVDAAIAANAALAVMEPMSCGLGGDLFAIVWDAKTKQLYGLNGSGRSPATLTLDEFRRQKLSHIPSVGPLPVTTPGCVDAWFELHTRFGILPMSQILAPAISYARNGFPVPQVIASYWQGAAGMKKFAGFADTYFPGGRAPAEGEIFRNPAIANTLEKIAENGRDAFYRGEIARTIDAFMRRENGFLRYEDLANHRSDWVEPVSTEYRGYRVWELPPNGQGIAVLQMLNILEAFDLRKAGFGSPDHLHWFIESKKLAFEDRARFYADPEFQKIPVSELISKEYANDRRKLIVRDKAQKVIEPGHPALRSGDTIYLTVADQDRNMVSLIQSNFRGFGSGLCPDGLGFCLQDRGELFDLEEGRFNTYAPGKRPFHTIIPAFVTKDGRPYLSFGVMGGDTQPQGHVQILVNMIDFQMNLQEAGDAPRVVHSGSSEPTGERMLDGGLVHLESGFPATTREELTRRGHHLEPAVGVFGGYQAILYDAVHDVYHAASESRKDGHAAGY